MSGCGSRGANKMINEEKNFGTYIRELREKHQLTQADVVNSTGINEKSLRRIETNKVIPRIDTLEALSRVLKEDLIQSYSKSNSRGMELFEKIKTEIEGKIKQSNYDELKKDVPRLKKLVDSIQSPYYILLYRQYILLIESISLYREGSDYQKSLEGFSKGLLLGNEHFSIDRYQNFSYSPMELRLLMNYALSFYRSGDKEKYLEILEFIMKEIDDDEPLYPIVAYNLATAYKRSDKHLDAIELIKKVIHYCKEQSDYSMLPTLYYGKGVSEYYLNRESYQNSFKKALSLTSLLGMEHLNASMKEKCREHFQFDLADE